MVDFSRAEGSKNHRASFIKTSSNVIDFVGSLQSEYNRVWEQLEPIRKEMAAIREETIQLIKNNKIRLGKQLGRCDNKELNEELLNAINALKGDDKEKIQINLIKINNRYDKIKILGQELERLSQKLAQYRVLEEDYDDEVVISMPKKETKKTTNTPSKVISTPKSQSKTEGLESVVDIHNASDALIMDFEAKTKPRKQEENKNPIEEDEDVRYFTATDLYSTKELASIQNELESEEIEESEDMYDDECVLFTITDKLTLKEIAKNVYQSEENWIPLYNYGNNTSKIDKKAKEYGVTVEEVVSNPGYLTDITLQFPTLLVMPEEITFEKEHKRSSRRAA